MQSLTTANITFRPIGFRAPLFGARSAGAPATTVDSFTPSPTGFTTYGNSWSLPRAGLSRPSSLDPAQLARMRKVADSLPPDVDPSLLERLLKKGLLIARDKNGHTLLDNLARLSQSPLVKDRRGKEIDRGRLMAQILEDVDNVRNIHQGRRNTCGATSNSIRLATEKPAEYARLLSELGRQGKATLPDGKSQISYHPDAFDRLSNADDSHRTLTGRLLQPALMDFANGSRVSYNDNEKQRVGNPLDRAADTVSRSIPLLGPLVLAPAIRGFGFLKNLFGGGRKETGAEQVRTVAPLPGLTQPEMARLSEALFGERQRVVGAGLGPRDLVRVMIPGTRPNYPEVGKALEEGQVPMFALIDTDQKVTPPGSKSLLETLGPLSRSRSGRLDPNLDHKPADGLHWLYVKRIEDGRVYFEDPNRVSKEQLHPDLKGKARLDPDGPLSWDPLLKPRDRPAGYRVEDDGTASMPLEDFKKVAWSLVIPDKKVAG